MKHDTRTDYEQIDAVNASVLIKGLKSMLAVRNAITGDVKVRTPGMEFGSQYHCLILEPDDFREKHRVMPDFKLDPKNQTKTGKQSTSATEWSKAAEKEFRDECEAAGVSVITQKNYDRALRMIESLRRCPRAMELLVECKREVTLRGRLLGIELKGRVDLLGPVRGSEVLGDLKGTVSAEPVEFGRRMANLQVKFRMAFYRELCRQEGREPDKIELIAQESDGDFDTAVYSCPEAWLDAGFAQVMEVLRKYKLAKESGVWHGCHGGLRCAEPLFVPNWDMGDDQGEGLNWGDIQPQEPEGGF